MRIVASRLLPSGALTWIVRVSIRHGAYKGLPSFALKTFDSTKGNFGPLHFFAGIPVTSNGVPVTWLR